ncbi:hypothetical protein GGX14DRAFT_406296 [Mycena pura]|uniref:Uncharacterized protein n=1 Tax=Mycena pura TaxID=153505 RepID=A0AAD6XYC1_9AGAR|nr:hypothetical protein GGX14DRAFT_406296 [Mycena pura]
MSNVSKKHPDGGVAAPAVGAVPRPQYLPSPKFIKPARSSLSFRGAKIIRRVKLARRSRGGDAAGEAAPHKETLQWSRDWFQRVRMSYAGCHLILRERGGDAAGRGDDATYEDDEYRDSHVAEWLQLALDEPTPELIELMRRPLNRLQDFRLVPIPGVERRLRATGVGQAMLQILAVQHELEEPLNLNGDTFEELLERAVKPAGERANEYMEAMRAMVLSTKPKVLAQKKHWDIDLFHDLIKKFWAEHASFSPSFRPPTYRRVDDRQSRRPVLLVQVPKAAEENPDGFEEEMRGRTRRRQNDDSEDEDTPPPKRQATTRRKLRPRGLKAAVQTQEPLGTVVAIGRGRGWVEIECPETTWGMAVVNTSAGGGDSACGGTLIVTRKNFCRPTAAARGDGDEGCGSDEEGRGDRVK